VVPLPLWIPSAVLSLFSPHSSLSLSLWIPSAVPSLFPRTRPSPFLSGFRVRSHVSSPGTHPLSEVPCHWLLVRVVLVFCSGGSSPSLDSECGPISLLPALVPLPFSLGSECGPNSLSPHSSLSLSVWIPSAVQMGKSITTDVARLVQCHHGKSVFETS
jgi:hypothetical protein